MPITVMVDGVKHVFPDGTTDDEISFALNGPKKSQTNQPPSQEENFLMKNFVRPANELAGSVVEPVLGMATGMAAKPISEIAGMAAIGSELVSPKGGDPEAFKRDVAEALTYKPRTQLGSSNLNPINAAINAAGTVFDAGGDIVANATKSLTGSNIAAAGAKESVLQGLGLVGAKTVPKIKAKGLKEKALYSERDAARQASKDAGLISPPEGGIVRKTLYQAGKAGDAVSLKNQQKATSLLARDSGLPENVPITKELITEKKQILNKSYDAFAGAFPGGVQISTPFVNKMKTKLADVQNKLATEATTYSHLKDVPSVITEQINKASGVRDAQGLIDSISALRNKADDAYAIGNPKAGKIYRDIADGYENAMGGQLKSSSNFKVYNEFEAARTKLAKLHFLSDVIDPVSGLVDFNLLRNKAGSSIKKKKFLTGDTKTVAEFAKQFKTASRQLTPDQIASLNKLEVTVPLAALGSTGGGAAVGASMFGSPLMGAALMAIPAGMTMAAPKLGTAGLLSRTPTYTNKGIQSVYGTAALAPYFADKEQQ